MDLLKHYIGVTEVGSLHECIVNNVYKLPIDNHQTKGSSKIKIHACFGSIQFETSLRNKHFYNLLLLLMDIASHHL